MTGADALNCAFEIVMERGWVYEGKDCGGLRENYFAFLGFSFAFAQLPAAILKLKANASQACFRVRRQ